MSAVLQEGFHEGIEADVYHSDPCQVASLSRSVAEKIIAESPLHAWLSHPKLGGSHERTPTKAMDFGSLGHAMLLGRGAQIAIGEFDDFKTKEARLWRDSARSSGKVPVLKSTYEAALVFAKEAKAELERLNFWDQFVQAKSEVVAVWRDEEVLLRAMFDKLLLQEENGIAEIFDVKITADANPKQVVKQIANMNYDLQDAFYRRGIERLTRCHKIDFTFLFFSAEPPHQLTPVQLNGEWRMIGNMKYGRALTKWKECTRAGRWPGYVDGILRAEPPHWLMKEELGAA